MNMQIKKIYKETILPFFKNHHTKIVLFSSLLLIIIGLVGLILSLTTTARADNEYDRLRKLISAPSESSAIFEKIPEPYDGKTGSSKSKAERPGKKTESAFDTDSDEFEKILYDLVDEIAGTLVSWIKIDGTNIDYPIMQSNDNSYYLNHLPSGKRNSLGTPFMDYRCSSDFSNEITIIYGHHSKSGNMFSALHNYKDPAFVTDHPYVNFETAYGTLNARVIAAYMVDGATEGYPIDFVDETDFEDFKSRVLQTAYFADETLFESGYHYIILSTCTYEKEDSRIAVICRY